MMKYLIISLLAFFLVIFCADKRRENELLVIKGAINLGFIPNSDTLVYLVRHSDSAYDYTIYKKALMGDDKLIRLIGADSSIYSLTFSPDAERFATVATINGNSGIWIFPSDKMTPPIYYETKGDVVLDIAWSSKCNQIAYCEKDGIAAHVWLLNLDNRKMIQLTSECSYDDAVVWTPHGEEIIYSTNRGKFREIIAIQTDGYRSQRLLKSDDVYELSHFVSPDGKYLFYHHSIEGKGSRLIMKNLENNKVYYDKYPYDVIMWAKLSSDGSKIVFNIFGKDEIILIVKEFRLTDFTEMDSTGVQPSEGLN